MTEKTRSKQPKPRGSGKPWKPGQCGNPGALQVSVTDASEVSAAVAQTVESPSVLAAATLYEIYKPTNGVEIEALRNELVTQIEKVHGGDLKRAESMLISQAHTLDALFNNLAQRAIVNIGEYRNAAETYLRLAFKAQAQCRSTLEALAEIKNPRQFAFVRQANFAQGPQQINNGPPIATARTAQNQIEQDELSRLPHEAGQQLAIAAQGTAGAADSRVAAVETVHGTEDRGGQGSVCAQRLAGRNPTDAPRDGKSAARAKARA